MLRRMLEASQRALAEYERHHGLKPLVLPPIVVPPVHIYRPTDYSRPQPPVGNYDAFNTPGVFGSSRPSCMPYYPGCSDAR